MSESGASPKAVGSLALGLGSDDVTSSPSKSPWESPARRVSSVAETLVGCQSFRGSMAYWTGLELRHIFE